MNGFGALELLARAAFLVKGVVYMVVGALALQVAAHLGGRVTGTRGASEVGTTASSNADR